MIPLPQEFDIFDSTMLHSFCIGDVEAIDFFLKCFCCPDLLFRVPSLSIEASGKTAILIFFMLLYDTYPDAAIRVLDRRIGTLTTVPREYQCYQMRMKKSIEYVHKITATRISTRPLRDSFLTLLSSTDLSQKVVCLNDIHCVVTSYLEWTSLVAWVEERDCAVIIENILTVDEENRIISWSFDILASTC